MLFFAMRQRSRSLCPLRRAVELRYKAQQLTLHPKHANPARSEDRVLRLTNRSWGWQFVGLKFWWEFPEAALCWTNCRDLSTCPHALALARAALKMTGLKI
ncbi:hypothetical protein AYO50_00730 [Acidobacteria bacterium SCGC AG-212-P17]|nr:hypothetical protein AYO50_00730 [Acidobacteria bacterium SCGC AG-212-P17]